MLRRRQRGFPRTPTYWEVIGLNRPEHAGARYGAAPRTEVYNTLRATRPLEAGTGSMASFLSHERTNPLR